MDLVPYFGLQDPVSSASHLLAAGFVLAGAYVLWRKGRGDQLRVASLMIFSATMLFLFSMSGVYHGLPPGPARDMFRRLDYASIWLVIAGSATPVHVLLFKGHWRWGLIAFFWGAALTAMIIVDVWFDSLPYWALVLAYFGLGSTGSISFAKITARYGWKETALLFLGGLAYSAGAAIDWLKGPVILNGVLGPHELFHFLVIAGAVLHWRFIYDWTGRRVD